MWRPALVIAAFLFSSVAARAGDIFGSLRERGEPRPNVPYQVFDLNNQPVSRSSQTASNGSFRLNLPMGRFRLVFSLPGNPTAEIFSSGNPAQYDFELVRRPDGSYSLDRR